MFTEKHFPTSIRQDELDGYLDRGWYRNGQSIFTCHFLMMRDALYSPVWLRLPLEGYHFRKGLRKILGRNDERFQTVFRPSSLDEEKEALFQRYSRSFKGSMPPTLRLTLLDDKSHNIYATQEVAVYDGERLIAASFFDLGMSSIASIQAIYDPEYASASLGIYTMLKEIEFGMSRGYGHYYPGYFVPGNPRFDYKLRMGKSSEVQFFDALQKCWRSHTEFGSYKLPLTLLLEKLALVGKALAQYGVSCQVLFFASNEGLSPDGDEKKLDSPLLLKCFDNLFAYPYFAIFYDPMRDRYVFCNFQRQEKTVQVPTFEGGVPMEPVRWFMDSGLNKSIILETPDATEIVRLVLYFDMLLKNQGGEEVTAASPPKN